MGKYNKGITLIALVITIIVLLILAGISIAMLTGENGILTKGNNAKEQTERQEVIENAKLKILEYETENEGKITDDKAYEIIAKYDKDYKENETFVFKTNDQDEEYFTTKEGYKILVKEVWKNFHKNVDEIEFFLDGYLLTAKRGETWRKWYEHSENQELVKTLDSKGNNGFTIIYQCLEYGHGGNEFSFIAGGGDVVKIRKKGGIEAEKKDNIITEGIRYVQVLFDEELEETFMQSNS